MAIIETASQTRNRWKYLSFLWTGLIVVTLPVPAFGQLIVAHRGASFSAPENTLAAFALAWKEEADAIEGDFRLTRDGHIVCIHE